MTPHDETNRRRHDQGLVRIRGRGGVHQHQVEEMASQRVLVQRQTVPADLVIALLACAGDWFLEGSGIACDHGVLTDAQLQTNVPGICRGRLCPGV
jgi:hypothetical protein